MVFEKWSLNLMSLNPDCTIIIKNEPHVKSAPINIYEIFWGSQLDWFSSRSNMRSIFKIWLLLSKVNLSLTFKKRKWDAFSKIEQKRQHFAHFTNSKFTHIITVFYVKSSSVRHHPTAHSCPAAWVTLADRLTSFSKAQMTSKK